MWLSRSPRTICWRNYSSSHCSVLPSLMVAQPGVRSVSKFSSVALVYFLVLGPAPFSPHDYSLVVSFELGRCELPTMIWMFVPFQISCVETYSHGDAFRGGLWAVIRSWELCLSLGILSLHTRHEGAPLLLLHVRTHGKQQYGEQALTSHQICWHLSLCFPVSRTVHNKWPLFINYPA
jgi:hypothetical protein